MKKPSTVTSQEVKKYYDNNTGFFLSLGTGKKNKSIHRAVWGEGVQNRNEAQEYAHQLILQTIETISTNNDIHVLDLGCGVGSTLFYLAEKYPQKAHFTGVTISTQQVRMAKEINQQLGFSCRFMEADFLHLPAMELVDFAYAIEAFIHAPDAAAFFQEITHVLKPGGRLVLIDDFLTEKGNSEPLPVKHQQWLESVEKGWMAGSLITPTQAGLYAKGGNLSLIQNENLTPYLELRRLRDQLISVMVQLIGKWAYQSTYFRSLRGGDALQKCLLHGLLEYRMLVFEKKK